MQNISTLLLVSNLYHYRKVVYALSKQFLDYLSESNPEMLEVLNKGFESNREAGKEHNRLTRVTKRADIFDEFIKEAAKNVEKDVKVVNYAVMSGDVFIRDEMLKMAGFDVSDTTPEGIETFLKEYFYNELSYFPDRLYITVNITPLDEAPKSSKEFDTNISNATGTVDINYNNALIQIPFMMREKEILPFDTIQMGAETAIYTRDNMRNILLNLKNMASAPPSAGLQVDGAGQNLSGFVGVDKHTNVSTDGGFMGDMIQIQHMLGQNSAPPYVHASLVNELLEKTADIKKVDIDYNELKEEVKRHARPKTEKIAFAVWEEDKDTALEKQAFLDQIDEEVTADVQILNNGDYFSFLEKDGMIVHDTVGVLFDKMTSLKGNNNIMRRIIIASDGRYKILEVGEGFVFNLTRTNSLPHLSMKRINIFGLNPGSMATTSKDGKQWVPFTITKTVSGAELGIRIPIIHECTDIEGSRFTLIPAADVGSEKVVVLDKKDILSRAMEIETPDKLELYNLCFKSKLPVVCVSSDSEFLKLKAGPINNITSRKDKMFLFDGNVKLAAFGDKVILILKDEQFLRFDIIATWVDKRSGMDRRIEVNNADKTKVVSALKTMGYSFDEISQLVHRTKKEGYAETDITVNIMPWKLEPEIGAAMAAAKVADEVKNSLFSKDNLKTTFSNLMGNIFGGIAAKDEAQRDAIKEFGVFASESKALAEKLEKIAIARESSAFTKIAGLMVIKNRLDNLFADTMAGGEFTGTEVLGELQELDPYISKIARDLVELKLAQSYHGNEIVSPNVINATLRHLDQLHKYAKTFS